MVEPGAELEIRGAMPGGPSAAVHGGTHAPAMQTRPPLQLTGSPPTQEPATQVSVWVQASPSSQEVAAGAGAVPHLPWVQAGTRHGPTPPPQSVAARHATQAPRPSHRVPPTEHALPAPAGSWTGRSSTQTSSVHGLPSSTGTHAAPPVPLDDEEEEVVVAEDVDEDAPPAAPVVAPVWSAPPQPIELAAGDGLVEGDHVDLRAREVEGERVRTRGAQALGLGAQGPAQPR
jgi:hypothetical protein